MSNVYPLANELESSPAEIGGEPVPPPAVGGARRAAAWTAGGFAAQQFLRLGFNVVLTRLVEPYVLGTMALIGLFVQFLHMLSDLGIRHCVVSHPDGENPAFLRTAWTIQVLRGLVMWVGSAAIAWPVAVIYHEPMYTWLLPLAGTVAALDGLGSTSVYVLGRRLHRGPIVRMELSCYVVGTVASIFGIWVISRGRAPGPDLTRDQLLMLVGGSLLSMGLQAIVSHSLLREVKHYFQWEPSAARELLHFGGWIFLSTACSFLGGQADRLVIGENAAKLGSYNPAVQLAVMPNLLLYDLLSQFALPLYSKKLGTDPLGIRRVHLALATLAACLICGLVVVVPTFALNIFPAKYLPAEIGWYAQLLAPGIWFTILQYQHETVLVAGRQMRLTTMSQAVRLIALVPCMMIGYHYGGWAGFIVGFKAPELVRYLILAVATAGRGLPLWRDDLMLTLAGAAVCAAFLAAKPLYAGDLVSYAWQGRWAVFALESAAVVAVWALIALALRWAGRIDPFWTRAKEGDAC